MIRKYKSVDLECVLTVWAAASAVGHPFLSEKFFTEERSNIANVYLPRAETWVWEAEGRVLGFISMLGHEIGGLFVEPTFHRKGIGRALVDHARGVWGELEVEVFEANAVGRAFYAKYGFELMQRKIDDETGLDVRCLKL